MYTEIAQLATALRNTMEREHGCDFDSIRLAYRSRLLLARRGEIESVTWDAE